MTEAGHCLVALDGTHVRTAINKLGTPYGTRYRRHGEAEESGDKSRFYILSKGQARPGRLRVPPAFACKAPRRRHPGTDCR
ncbi:hypothetical protein [Actinomadura miaoliensis]|uniref:Transposase n=1 Tax=Actinomadura miaoliensis TaxID=430685 RepID=A0ABP7UXB9_9ACTN